jgi:hypothetical protein
MGMGIFNQLNFYGYSKLLLAETTSAPHAANVSVPRII